MANAMRSFPPVLSVFVCVVLLAAPTNGQVTKSGSGYLLRVKYTAGSSLKYLVRTSTSTPGIGGAEPIETKLDLPVTLRVKAVDKGIATLEVSMSPPDSEGRPGEPVTTTVKSDSLGRSVGGGQGFSLGSVAFPQKPVAVGDSWTDSSVPQSGPAAGVPSRSTYTLLGIKALGGKQVAEIQTNRTMGDASQGMTIAVSGKIYVLVEDGSLHSANLTQTLRYGSGTGASTAKSSIVIVRQ